MRLFAFLFHFCFQLTQGDSLTGNVCQLIFGTVILRIPFPCIVSGSCGPREIFGVTSKRWKDSGKLLCSIGAW